MGKIGQVDCTICVFLLLKVIPLYQIIYSILINIFKKHKKKRRERFASCHVMSLFCSSQQICPPEKKSRKKIMPGKQVAVNFHQLYP